MNLMNRIACCAVVALLSLSGIAHAGETGKCCLPDGRGCRTVTQEQCDAAGGVFVSGEACTSPEDTCEVVVSGACCVGGECSFTSSSTCPAGASFFPNTPCTAEPCAVATDGACCDAGVCFTSTRDECSGDFFLGEVCGAVPCGQVALGACCFQAQCEVTTQPDCPTSLGAEWLVGEACRETLCNLGACCLEPEICVLTTQLGCETGFWVPAGTCADLFCQQPLGSCCRQEGFCVVTTEIDCGVGGAWAPGDLCGIRQCFEVLGACCTGGPSCTVTSEALCAGTFIPGDSCVAHNACCPADYDADQGVTVADLFDFLDDWFALFGTSVEGSRTDINHNGNVGVDDLFLFLDAWFAQCA